jgi:uncharacterized protein YjiS (DUF1127 family)
MAGTSAEWRVWPAPGRLKKLKQLSALADISAKHKAPKQVPIPAGDAWGVTRMARTRDVLDELAEWYAPPASRAPAWQGASAPRSFIAPREAGIWSTVRRAFVGVVGMLLAWHDRARERRSLMELSDQMLRDIGISRAQALGAAARTTRRI